MEHYASLINLADVRKDNALSKQDHECPQWNQAAILERHHEESRGSQGPELVHSIRKVGTAEFQVSFIEDGWKMKTFNGKNWS